MHVTARFDLHAACTLHSREFTGPRCKLHGVESATRCAPPANGWGQLVGSGACYATKCRQTVRTAARCRSAGRRTLRPYGLEAPKRGARLFDLLGLVEALHVGEDAALVEPFGDARHAHRGVFLV